MSDTPRTKEIDKLRDYVNNQESEYKTLGAYAIAFDRLDLMVMESERENQELRAQLDALVMCVARKFPNESRYETAKRYICEAEREAGNEQVGAKTEGKEEK